MDEMKNNVNEDKADLAFKSFKICLFLFVALFFFEILGDLSFKSVRDYDSAIQQKAMESVKALLPEMTPMQLDYIQMESDRCWHNQHTLRDIFYSTSDLSAMSYAGWFGLSEEEMEKASDLLRLLCLKEYVLAAESFEDLESRNKQLGAISPYVQKDLVAIYKESNVE